VLVVLAGAFACGESTPVPTAPIASNSGRPQPTALTITGNTSLAAVGDVSHLTATAGWPDGSTRIVNSDVRWTADNESIIRISSDGTVTAVGLGLTTVNAFYGSLTKTLPIMVTPVGTVVVSGRVREPGSGGIPEVIVRDAQSGKSTTSDHIGIYQLAGLGAVAIPHLMFEKDGYELSEIDATPNSTSTRGEVGALGDDVPLQRMIRLEAGETITPPKLVFHDVTYTVGTDRCFPCRRIRVRTRNGTLHVQLTWNDPSAMLQVWIAETVFSGRNGQVVASLPVASGELVVYVGMRGFASASMSSVSFTLGTSLSPAS